MFQIAALLSILTAALLAGCAGDENTGEVTDEIEEEATELAENEAVEQRATTAAQEQADELQWDETLGVESANAAETVAAGADANTVQVELTEFEIRMPTTLPAGLTQFQVTNVGTGPHSLVLETEDTEVAFENHLEVGETKRLLTKLSPGTYTVYCPVGEHREKGMRLDLEVAEN